MKTSLPIPLIAISVLIAVLVLGTALLLGLLAMRRAACENQALRDEIARRTQADDERAARQSEMEEGAQSLAQTNTLLAEASGRFQELFQGLPVACLCCDREGRIMEWNRAWAQMHGQENPLGRRVEEALGDPDGAPALAEAVRAALGGEAREGGSGPTGGPTGRGCMSIPTCSRCAARTAR